MTRAVFLFHGIDDSGSKLSFPIDAFVRLVEGLRQAGIPILTFQQLLESRRGVTLTFDDALQSVRNAALPVLRATGAPAHLFVTTGHVGGANRWAGRPSGDPLMEVMTWDGIAECAVAGMTIENHTATHADLGRLSPAAALDEFAVADEAIERHVGRRPRFLAYPYGNFAGIAEGIARARYEAAFTTELRFVSDGTDLHRVPRIGSHYLRARWMRSGALGPVGRAFIASRRIGRAVRKRLGARRHRVGVAS